MMNLPEQAKPHEVAIIRIYLSEERNPQRIAQILHYRSRKPVLRVLHTYRPFLNRALETIYQSASVTLRSL